MSYGSVANHRTMVFDDERNGRYATAMRECITPESVVLDLGAGLGIHGLLAAAAGARRVYLVEPEPVVQVAMELARANGLADRVQVLQGRIEEVELPEKVDLIVSVFTGNLLFSEDLLPSLFHARDRYLKPDGKMLPDCAELWLAPVAAPALHAENVSSWSGNNLGLDFSSARRFAANTMIETDRHNLAFAKLASGAVMTTVDLRTASTADCRGEASCVVTASGTCDALLGWIRIKLGEQWLSTDVDSPPVHWLPVVLPVDPPLLLSAGERVTMKLQRPLRGDWSWTLSADGGERRHSSFLGRCDGPRRLQVVTAAARQPLTLRGEAMAQVLALMQQGTSNGDIAHALATDFPRLFANSAMALLFVQQAALQYRVSSAVR